MTCLPPTGGKEGVAVDKIYTSLKGDRCNFQVFYGIPFKKGDRILTSVIEYGANYIAFLQVSIHFSIC
jgi:cysteine desulfurase/selenocysteine lyase